jgi:hypothetical protein
VYCRGENVKGKIHEDITKQGKCVVIIEQDANKGFTLNFDKNIYLDHIFADPKTEYLSISSNIQDEDGGGMTGDNDMMNGDQTRWRTLADLARISAKSGEWNLPGDRDSENVEVYYTVTFVKDLY